MFDEIADGVKDEVDVEEDDPQALVDKIKAGGGASGKTKSMSGEEL